MTSAVLHYEGVFFTLDDTATTKILTGLGNNTVKVYLSIIIFLKTTAAENEDALSYHRVRGLHLPLGVFEKYRIRRYLFIRV